MARRTDHTREVLTNLALNAGLEQIKQDGFARFSIRKVAAAIGYTVGTLYHIFGSYDEFILHINARTLDEWFAFMRDALEKSIECNKLKVLAQAYSDYSRTHYPQWIALFEHHGSQPLPDWYKAKTARFFTLTEQLLLPLCGGDAGRAQQHARVLWAGIHGICILSLSGKLENIAAEPPERMALSLVEHYIKGISS